MVYIGHNFYELLKKYSSCCTGYQTPLRLIFVDNLVQRYFLFIFWSFGNIGFWQKVDFHLSRCYGRDNCCTFHYFLWTDSIKLSLLFSYIVGSLYFWRIRFSRLFVWQIYTWKPFLPALWMVRKYISLFLHMQPRADHLPANLHA